MEKFKNTDEKKTERQIYEYDDFIKFLSAKDDLKYKCLWQTLYYCGLRIGEDRGLTWEDIDFSNKRLHINKQVLSIDNYSSSYYVCNLKTASSNRILTMCNALYDDFAIYARPLEMFVSEVDHVKYPQVTQKYRFEQVDPVTMNNIDNGMPEEDSPLEKFLDARGYEDKLDVLMRNKDKFTDEMIDIMAESLEVVVPEADTSKRLESLKKVLQAHTKYEGSHLRP